LAGGGIERANGAARSRRGVDDAVDHQRRSLIIELGPRPERIGLEPPRDFECAEVLFVDLIEWRIASAGEIAAVCGPFASSRFALAMNDRDVDSDADDRAGKGQQRQRAIFLLKHARKYN